MLLTVSRTVLKHIIEVNFRLVQTQTQTYENRQTDTFKYNIICSFSFPPLHLFLSIPEEQKKSKEERENDKKSKKKESEQQRG